jgi:glyoxylate reductase
LLAFDVTAARLGVTGMRRFGKTVACRIRGFAMQVLYWSRIRLSDEEEGSLAVTHGQVQDVLIQSDFISVQVALHDRTRHMIGDR